MSKVLIIDAEIKKAILGRGETPKVGVEYCDGWRAFGQMGLSVLGGYQSWDEQYRTWDSHPVSLASLHKTMSEAEHIVTFNGRSFDGPLLDEMEVHIPDSKHVDLLASIWEAHGLSWPFKYPSHAGFGLDACCIANDISKKTGNGAMAPVLWQQGRFMEVTDYCLHDIWMTLKLARLCLAGHFISPKTGQNTKVRLPFSAL